MADDLPEGSSVRIDGLTPRGGAYSICYYHDSAKNPCPEDRATGAEIVEFATDGRAIHRTYTKLGVA